MYTNRKMFPLSRNLKVLTLLSAGLISRATSENFNMMAFCSRGLDMNAMILGTTVKRVISSGPQLAFIRREKKQSSDRTKSFLHMHHGKTELTFNDPPALGITSSSASLTTFTGNLLILPFYQIDSEEKSARVALEGALSALDATVDGALGELIEMNEFQGKTGTSAIISLGKAFNFRKIAIVGLGKKSDKVDAFIKLGAFVASTSEAEKAKVVGLSLDTNTVTSFRQLQTTFEAIRVSLYKDKRFKDSKDDKPVSLQKIEVLGSALDVTTAATFAEIYASGINLCRDLVNAPANYVTPTSLANTAVAVAKAHGLEYSILDQEQIEALKMGAYLGVAQGAIEPPKFIHLTYKPSGEAKKKVAIIGKGLTFDSGGYNLKAGAGSMIEMMKFDMGGSAATIGAAKVIGQLKPQHIEVHFIVAACENMVSDRAMRPGDILTASNGKTIEVLNTDAEGRLTLADALVFAENLGVDAIVDSATLTGACIVALGDQYAGLWSSDDELATALKQSAEQTGEKIWQMPLQLNMLKI